MSITSIKNRITTNSEPKDKFFNVKTIKELKKAGEIVLKSQIQTELNYLVDEIKKDSVDPQDQYFLSMAIKDLRDLDDTGNVAPIENSTTYLAARNKIETASPKDKFFLAKTLKELKRSGELFIKDDIINQINHLKSKMSDASISNQDQYFISMALRELEDLDDLENRKEIRYNVVDSLPAGTILSFSTSVSLPSGFYPCDGRGLYRNDEPQLFNKIGVSHGEYNGDAGFKIPKIQHDTVTGLQYAIKATDGLKNQQTMSEKLNEVEHTLSIHKHSINDITDLSLSWDSITGKPESLTPTAHTHPMSDITGLSLDWSAIQNKPSFQAANSALSQIQPMDGYAHGSLMISGSKGSYGGIRFNSENVTLMINQNGACGFYQNNAEWGGYVDMASGRWWGKYYGVNGGGGFIGRMTASTAGPSGGNDGDVHIVI